MLDRRLLPQASRPSRFSSCGASDAPSASGAIFIHAEHFDRGRNEGQDALQRDSVVEWLSDDELESSNNPLPRARNQNRRSFRAFPLALNQAPFPRAMKKQLTSVSHFDEVGGVEKESGKAEKRRRREDKDVVMLLTLSQSVHSRFQLRRVSPFVGNLLLNSRAPSFAAAAAARLPS